MPVTQGSNVINVLATSLAQSIQSGAPTRQTLGAKSAAFGWTSGLPRGFWSFTSTATVEGPGFVALTIEPSGTPVAKVAEGGTKANAVTITPRTLALSKYAGLAEFSLERAAYSDVLPQAVTQCLVAGALVALEQDLATEAVTTAGTSLTGDTDWTTGILRAIGTVAGNGGNPNMLVMSPADFAAAVDGPQQLVFNGTDAIPHVPGPTAASLPRNRRRHRPRHGQRGVHRRRIVRVAGRGGGSVQQGGHQHHPRRGRRHGRGRDGGPRERRLRGAHHRRSRRLVELQEFLVEQFLEEVAHERGVPAANPSIAVGPGRHLWITGAPLTWPIPAPF